MAGKTSIRFDQDRLREREKIIKASISMASSMTSDVTIVGERVDGDCSRGEAQPAKATNNKTITDNAIFFIVLLSIYLNHNAYCITQIKVIKLGIGLTFPARPDRTY